jgi:hypothetical protein
MSWLRLPLEYARTFFDAIRVSMRVQRVHRLQANDYSIGSPTSGTPPLKLGPIEVHRLRARTFDLGFEFSGDSAGEARARRFLYRVMVRYPNGIPGKTKKDFERWCHNRCDVSRRSFERLWGWAIDKSGAIGYRDPGRRN